VCMFNISWEEIQDVIISNTKTYDQDWRIRKRKIDTGFLILFLMRISFSFSQSGYQIIINEIWERLRKTGQALPQETPFAASSVCEARMKLDPNIIYKLNQEVAESFLACHDAEYRWNNKRLFIVDGSRIILPSELKKEGFGISNPDMHYPPAKISVLMHAGSGVAVDIILDKKGNERELALQHLDILLAEEDVVIYDRGYFSYEVALIHILRGIDGIFRIPLSGCTKSIQEFIDAPDKPIDKIITIEPNASQKKLVMEHNPEVKCISIQIRLIRYEIEGQEYILATTILDKKITGKEFADIYENRWDIEEHYKASKTILSLEKFHAKTLRGIYQEIYIAEFMLTLSRIIAIQGEK